jgi:hypothetical protein
MVGASWAAASKSLLWKNLDVRDGAVGVNDDAAFDVGKGMASLIGEVSSAPVAGTEEEEECKG